MRSLMFSLAALASSVCMTSGSVAQTAPLARGQALVAENCGSCHAIGARGESPMRGAPTLRTLAHNYPVAYLEEALAEGIDVGHPEMPEYTFAPEDVNAIVAYLETIQAPQQQRRTAPPAVG